MANQAFALTPLSTPAVQTICMRLDGIPLAIELAAARVRALPAEKIAERLNVRFRLLTGGSRTALPRQQTLRGVIDWSYSLLTESERTLLRRLAVFVGGWTLEAAETVCSEGLDDVLDTLTRLVDKSLVMVDESGRYRLLETIRQYAREKLADTEEGGGLRDRHLDYFVRFSKAVEPQIERSQPVDLDKAEVDIDNIRAALDWAMETEQLGGGLRILSALQWFWAIRGHQIEGVNWLRNLLMHPASQDSTLERGLGYVALALLYGRYSDATDLQADSARQALSIATDLDLPNELVYAHIVMAIAMINAGDFETARAYTEHIITVVTDTGDQHLKMIYHYFMYELERAAGDHDDANQHFEKASVIDPGELLWSSVNWRRRGYNVLDAGDRMIAEMMFHNSLVKNHQALDRQGIAACLTTSALSLRLRWP